MGIVDTLSSGFDRVTRRPWLIVVPVLLNICTWIGPRLSISTLTKELMLALPSTPGLGSQYEQSMEVLGEWLAELGARANLLSTLSMGILGLPSLTPVAAPPSKLFHSAQGLIEVRTWAGLVGIIALFALLGLFIGCFCLSLIAQQARDEPVHVVHALAMTWRSWLRLVALVVLVLAAVAMATAGISIVSGLIMPWSPGFAWLLLNAFALGALWLSMYAGVVFFFAPRAIVMNDMGIPRSLWTSFSIVRYGFLPSIGFILVVNVIQAGLAYIWHALAVSSAGTLLGITGNAYVSVGLVMGSFIFYRDKLLAWQEAKAQAKTNEGRQ